MSEDIKEKDGLLYDEWRAPVNEWSTAPGSIHNDEVAHKVGMRGGTIPGTVHLKLFTPPILIIFDQQ